MFVVFLLYIDIGRRMKKLLSKVGDTKDTMITFKSVESHPVGKKTDLTEGVCTERLANNADGTLFFRVSMNKGSLVFQHHHDCLEEIVLYKGKLLEVISNEKIDHNLAVRFKPGEYHAIYALEDSIFYCQLYKPKLSPRSK